MATPLSSYYQNKKVNPYEQYQQMSTMATPTASAVPPATTAYNQPPVNTLDVLGGGISDAVSKLKVLQDRIATEGVTGLTPNQNVGGNAGVGAGVGGNTGSSAIDPNTQAILDALAKIGGSSNIDDIFDQYSQFREKMGIPAKEQAVATAETGVAGVQTKIKTVEDQINNLEADITARASGKMVTAPYLRRQLAVEGTPLRSQLSDLVSQQDVYQRGFTSAQSALSSAGGDFGDFSTLYGLTQKQTPVQELQQMIATELTKKGLNIGSYYQEPAKQSYTEVSPGNTVIDTSGKVIYTAPAKAEETGAIPGLTKAQETAFWSAIDKAKNELQQGEVWGNVWNRVKNQFPKVDNAQIDNALGTSWREPGAYQKFLSGKEKPPATLEQIKSQTKSIFQQYKDSGYKRKDIENQWKSENNTTTLSPIVKSILDEMFK